MPLWNIYHPVGAYTAEDKQEMAKRIVDIYIIPRFYVGVLFHEQPKESFFMGGEPRDDFVRIRLDQFARHIAKDAECVPISAMDIPAVVAFAKEKKIDLVFVAPDDPLAAGMVDALEKEGIPAFGPRANAAIIEASKVFSKDLMKRYHIHTESLGLHSRKPYNLWALKHSSHLVLEVLLLSTRD